jgi:hypothetical protein
LLDRLRESVHLWNALPIALVAVTLTAGGFWLGSTVSGEASAVAATRTIRLQGRVITVNGVQYVSTPARIVKVKAKDGEEAKEHTHMLADDADALPAAGARRDHGQQHGDGRSHGDRSGHGHRPGQHRDRPDHHRLGHHHAAGHLDRDRHRAVSAAARPAQASDG